MTSILSSVHTASVIEIVQQCSECRENMECSSCIECRKEFPLDKSDGTKGTIYCFGPEGETWHMCASCYTYLKNLKCVKCNSDNINRWGKDTVDGVKIVHECLACKNTWETGRDHTNING